MSSIYGHAAEYFSATPLLGIASVLVNRRLPRMLHATDTRAADGNENIDRFASICTDFTGCVSGILLDTSA